MENVGVRVHRLFKIPVISMPVERRGMQSCFQPVRLQTRHRNETSCLRCWSEMIGDELHDFRVEHLEPLVPEVARVSELIHLLQSVREQI